MSGDVSPFSYSPLKPMLYPNNGNGCLNTSAPRENDHYFNSEEMNRRSKRNSWDPTLNSESFMTRSEMPSYRDRSSEPAALAYDYPPDRTYSNGSISERLPYQYSHFHREPERVTSLHHPMEHGSQHGFRSHSIGSDYSNGFSSYGNNRDWPSWRMESTSQVASSSSSYDDPRRRPPHLDYNPSSPNRPSNYDNQKDYSTFWKPESPQVSSSSWNANNHEPSKWYPKPVAIPRTVRLVRPKLEPSYPWKRTVHEDHDRKTSLDNRTVIPILERRRISSENYNPDPRRNDNPQGPTLMQSPPDYPNRRIQHIPIPPPLSQPSSRFQQRDRYRDFYRPPDSRWVPSTYTPKRRPLHRISARISARPRRSPSQTESSSETSRSRSRQSNRRSCSRSRSSDRSRSRYDGGQSRSQARHSIPSSKSNGFSEASHNNSNGRSYRRETTRESELSNMSPRKPNSASHYKKESEIRRGRKRRTSSASSYSSESSIRSSMNSYDEGKSNEAVLEVLNQSDSHNNVSHEGSPTAPVVRPLQKESIFSVQSQVPLSFPSIEDNLELPGMRFNKNGVPKSDISPTVNNKHAEVGHDKIEISKPLVPSETPPPGLNEVNPSKEDVPNGQMDEEVRVERLLPTDLQTSIIIAPSRDELIPDDRMETGSDRRLDMTTPSDEVLSMTESESPLPNSPIILETKTYFPEVTIVSSTQVPESSPLTDFAPLSSSPVINIIEETAEMEIPAPMPIVEKIDRPPTQPKTDLASALRQFVADTTNTQALPDKTQYDYVFEHNLALKDASAMRKQTSNQELVQEVMEGSRFQQRLENHSNVAQVLIEQFRKRSEDFAAKTRRLRAEYKTLHMRWVTNCRKLDQNLASQTTQPPSPTFRASRRTAGFGDIVRSDLEMEQIIAALGNEDMTDPNVLAIRNTATIPDLLTSDCNNLDVDYVDESGLVEDPVEFFDIYSALGRWTEEEKDLFLEKFGTYPKQFDVIASFLPGKTPTQCIIFYYLHKKELLDFRAAVKKYGPKRKRGRKGGKGKGKGNALLADIMKPSRGQDGDDAGHRQMQQFGGMAAINGQKIISRRSLLKEAQSSGGAGSLNMSNGSFSFDAAKNDANSKSRSESPEEVDDSAIVVDHRRTRSIKPVEPVPTETDEVVASTDKPKEKSKRPPGRPPKQPRHPVRTEEPSSSTTPVKVTSYVWTKAEEAQYLKLVKEHGKDFKKIAAGMPAKTELQCRNYFRKHREFERIAKEVEDKLAKSSRS